MGDDKGFQEYVLYCDGEPLGKITEVQLPDEEEYESVKSFKEFSGEFSGTLTMPLKPNRKTIRLFRKYLWIDLLPAMFPKKKNRRQKRINAKNR